MKKAVTYTIHALWTALKRDKEFLLKEFLEADKDNGNKDALESFSKLEGEGFIGLDDFKG